MKRRTFIVASAVSAAVPAKAASSWQFFTADEATLVDALCEQIIPADKDPGARQAGVVRYIDRQLTGPLQRFARSYRTRLPELEHACIHATGKKFVELPAPEQTRFLEGVEKGPNQSLATFFAMIVDHTMQGFYGDPKHGGNAGDASWKMLGIEEVMGGHHSGGKA
jgi:gluconate 2-dehydrogenase gamma chain